MNIHNAEYEHSSMAGTYMLPCLVLGFDQKEVLIEYFDFILEKVVKDWVPKDYVKGLKLYE